MKLVLVLFVGSLVSVYSAGESHGEFDDVAKFLHSNNFTQHEWITQSAHERLETIETPAERIKRLNSTRQDAGSPKEITAISQDLTTTELTLSRRRRYSYMGDGKSLWVNMPVTFGFKNYLPDSKMSKKVQEDVARDCASKWAAVSGLSFVMVRDKIPNIRIEFVKLDGALGTKKAGEGNHIGEGQMPQPYSNPPSSFLQLDEEEDWTPRWSVRFSAISLQETMCHEFGHCLGLNHSTIRQAVMFADTSGRGSDTRLSSDDIAGIQSLYGKPSQESLSPDLEQRNLRVESVTPSPRTTPKPTTPKPTPPPPPPPPPPTAPPAPTWAPIPQIQQTPRSNRAQNSNNRVNQNRASTQRCNQRNRARRRACRNQKRQQRQNNRSRS